VNIVRTFPLVLGPGDEILSTDHEYGACDYAWEFVCKKTGATLIHRPISLPTQTSEEIVEQFWQGVTHEPKSSSSATSPRQPPCGCRWKPSAPEGARQAS